MPEGLNLDDARQAIAEAKRQRAADCGEELSELLRRHDCSLASYQELVNGIPKGPAQVVIVANE
jgi:hypothetical protein